MMSPIVFVRSEVVEYQIATEICKCLLRDQEGFNPPVGLDQDCRDRAPGAGERDDPTSRHAGFKPTIKWAYFDRSGKRATALSFGASACIVMSVIEVMS